MYIFDIITFYSTKVKQLPVCLNYPSAMLEKDLYQHNTVFIMLIPIIYKHLRLLLHFIYYSLFFSVISLSYWLQRAFLVLSPLYMVDHVNNMEQIGDLTYDLIFTKPLDHSFSLLYCNYIIYDTLQICNRELEKNQKHDS